MKNHLYDPSELGLKVIHIQEGMYPKVTVQKVEPQIFEAEMDFLTNDAPYFMYGEKKVRATHINDTILKGMDHAIKTATKDEDYYDLFCDKLQELGVDENKFDYSDLFEKGLIKKGLVSTLIHSHPEVSALDAVERFGIGDEAIIVKNLNRHEFDIGETVIIVDIDDNVGYQAENAHGIRWWVRDNELEVEK